MFRIEEGTVTKHGEVINVRYSNFSAGTLTMSMARYRRLWTATMSGQSKWDKGRWGQSLEVVV